MRIDAHQHLWAFDAAEYGWIVEGGLDGLRRDFLGPDLDVVLEAHGIDGSVAVQARQTEEETRFLLEAAREHPRILGVVGWVDLADGQRRGAALERFGADPRFVGVRHIAQDEPDGFLDGGAFRAGVADLAPRGLTYDLLVYERQLEEALRFVDALPESLPIVLDHIAKPRIAEGALEPWRERFADLARRPNVTCKVSGLVTEADHAAWTEGDLRPYLDVALEAFGPSRLMFGSDWPVSTLAATYGRWLETVERWATPLSEEERAALFGGTAARVYGVGG